MAAKHNDSADLAKLLAKMNEEADEDEEEAESTTAPKSKVEQNIQAQLREFLSRHDKDTPGEEVVSDTPDNGPFSASDFEEVPEETETDEEPATELVEEVSEEAEPKEEVLTPEAEEEKEEDEGLSPTETQVDAVSHLQRLREERMQRESAPKPEETAVVEEAEEDDGRAPWLEAEEPAEAVEETEEPEETLTKEELDEHDAEAAFNDAETLASDIDSSSDAETEAVFPQNSDTVEEVEAEEPVEEELSLDEEKPILEETPVVEEEPEQTPEPEVVEDKPEEKDAAPAGPSKPFEVEEPQEPQAAVQLEMEGLPEPIIPEEVEETFHTLDVAPIDDDDLDPDLLWGTKDERQKKKYVQTTDAKPKAAKPEPEQMTIADRQEVPGGNRVPGAHPPVHRNPAAKYVKLATPKPKETDTKLSDEDALMMASLGFEDEVIRMVGKRRYDEIVHNDIEAQRIDRLQKKKTPLKETVPEDYDGSIASAEFVRKQMAQKSFMIVTRLLLSVFVMVFLFIMDHIGLGVIAAKIGINTPVSNAFILAMGMQFMVLLYIISFRQMTQGAVGFLKFKPNLWTPVFIMILFTFVYDCLLLFQPANFSLPLMHMPSAICVIWSLVADMLSLAKDARDFEVVADGEVKYVLKPLPSRKRVRADEKGYISYVRNMDESETKLGVSKTQNIRNFLATSRREPKDSRLMSPLVYVVPLLSFVLAVGSYAVQITRGQISSLAYHDSLQLFALLVLVSTPISLIVGYSYPHLRAAMRLHTDGAAIIGRDIGRTIEKTNPKHMTDDDPTTPAEPTHKTFIVFQDDYMFREMLEVRIRSLGSMDPAEGMRRLAAIAKTVGGDMKRFIDAKKINDIGEVRVIKYKQNGMVFAYSKDHSRMIFGNNAFMNEMGYHVPDDLLRSELELERDVSRLYLASDAQLEMAMDVVYSPDPEFIKRVKELDNYGLYTGIQSYDPSLTDGFMFRLWADCVKTTTKDGRRISVDVYKPFSYEEDYVTVNEETDICADSEDALCEAVLVERELGREHKRNIRRGWIAAGIGIVTVSLLWYLRQMDLCNGLTVSVYQSVWAIATMLLSPFQGVPRRIDEETKAWQMEQRARKLAKKDERKTSKKKKREKKTDE